MNYAWLFFFLVFGACGYLEYSNLQEKITATEHELAGMQAKVDAAEAAQQKLEGQKKSLSQSIEMAQTTVADLSTQLRADEQALASAKIPVPGSQTTPAAPAKPAGN